MRSELVSSSAPSSIRRSFIGTLLISSDSMTALIKQGGKAYDASRLLLFYLAGLCQIVENIRLQVSNEFTNLRELFTKSRERDEPAHLVHRRAQFGKRRPIDFCNDFILPFVGSNDEQG